MALSTCSHTLGAFILISISFLNGITALENLSPETLAEKYPYVVALLDSARQYVCTGTIFNRNTVLTSGHCTVRTPSFVAVGLAVLSNQTNPDSIFEISAVELHHDYVFELRAASNLSTYRFHSNIGVAIVKGSKLTLYIQPPTLRNIGTEEIKHKTWTIVGYGKSEKSPNMLTLRQEEYKWSPCFSKKWYYCVCGIESPPSVNDESFGEGAPLIIDSQHLLAVTALPCGALRLSKNGIKYNIFTVVTPYIAWIKKSAFFDRRDVKVEIRRNVMANAVACQINSSDSFNALCMVFIVCKLLYKCT